MMFPPEVTNEELENLKNTYICNNEILIKSD